MRVLLVDDHTAVRQALCTLLEAEADIEVVGEASDGQQGVALTGQLRPEIVLMDVAMPVMDGIQATRAIHAADPQVCVIGLSMYERDPIDTAMRLAGAMGFVSKSALPDELLVVLRDCYARMREQQPPAAAA